MKTLRFALPLALCASCVGVGNREQGVGAAGPVRPSAYDELVGEEGSPEKPLHAGIGWQLLTLRIGSDGQLAIGPCREVDADDAYTDYPQAVALIGLSF